MNRLEGIKPGDEIFVRESWGPGQIVKVDRVTPSGRVFAGPFTFNPDGRERGASGYYSSFASPVTQDNRDSIARHRMEVRAQEVHDKLRLRNKSADFLSRYLAAVEPLLAEQDRPEKDGDR